MRLKQLIFAASFLIGAAMPVHAAKWQTVARQAGERIEIDKTRIARVGDGLTLAWSRLVLDQALNLGDKPYTIVEALNRYDCVARRFLTVKRVYLQAGTPIKEESVSGRAIYAEKGSVDDELLTEVCKPRTVGEMQQVAELARQAATRTTPQSSATLPTLPTLPAEQAPAKIMLADVRRLADDDQDHQEKSSRIRVVSDSSAESQARINLPNKADLAAKAAAEKAVLMPSDGNVASAAAPSVAAPTKEASPRRSASSSGSNISSTLPVLTSESKGSKTTATPDRDKEGVPVIATPAVTLPVRPYYREISRGAPRRKAIPKAVVMPVVENPEIHWSYAGEGGPANWGKLRSDYALCATGKRQSPIDIRDGIQVDLETIAFDYKNTLFRIVDNGHTVQVFVGEGSSMTVMGRRYALQQIHFHRPSEERVNGMAFDMVAHLVHQDLDGHIAVVAVLLETGTEHPLIQKLWNNMPLEVGQELTPSTPINLTALLPDPDHRAYWTYMGSLTTPPCTEDVLWLVLKQPQQVSAEQVAIFARLYRNNARPIQPVNNRLIKGSR